MGLTPFACITLPDCVRIAYPDGHVDSLSRACSVYELLFGNPDYFLCGSFPHTIANRMAPDELLQEGTTYFVCATPNAQPFIEFQSKKASHRILPRLSRYGIRGMREMFSSGAHGSAQARYTKVFDVHSATMQQQLESMRNNAGERPPKHLLFKLVFVRHCLQALRLPRTSMKLPEPALSSPSNEVPAPAPALPVFKSAARSELGLYVSRRQEFYLRRARRRRKILWKPVLQSISEMAPVEFDAPASQEENESSASKRFSPPRPAPPRKNISPPRQPVLPAPLKNISPPRQQASVAKHSAPPPQLPQQQQQRTRGSNRSLYMA